MHTFEESIAILTRQQTAPADHARTTLAPARSEAVALKQTLATWIAAHRPALEAAQKKYALAAERGVVHPNLGGHLAAVFGTLLVPGLLVTAPASCDELVARIDALTNFDAAGVLPLQLAGRLTTLRPLLGHLQELAAVVEKEERELAGALQTAAAAAGPRIQLTPADRGPAPRPTGIPVETQFDPTRA